METLKGKKTYIVAIGIVVAAVVSFLSGDTTLAEAVNTSLNGLGLAALRNGVGE